MKSNFKNQSKRNISEEIVSLKHSMIAKRYKIDMLQKDIKSLKQRVKDLNLLRMNQKSLDALSKIHAKSRDSSSSKKTIKKSLTSK